MRVAMVILEYHPVVGGAQRQLASIAPLLRERGIEVHVLTRTVEGRAHEELIDGVQVHRLPAPGPKAVASLVFTKHALARLRALQPDVVHAYSLFSPATIAMVARGWLGIPTVLKVLRGGIGGDVERLRRKTLSNIRVRGLRRFIDGFLAISTEIDAELGAIGIRTERRRAIPNGVDTTRFSPPDSEEKLALRRDQGLPVDAPIAVYCGRLVPEKRVDVLIDAWKAVRQRVPGACLSIVGGGPEEESLRARAGEGVRFEGAIGDVVPRLQSADAFVLPSEAEGLSNALLEAAATALPVVATRVGGAVDVVQPGLSGLLVPPNDDWALADALTSLLRDPDRGKLGARGREIVLATYSLDAVADRLRDLYEEVTSVVRSKADSPTKAPVGSFESSSCPQRHPPREPRARVQR